MVNIDLCCPITAQAKEYPPVLGHASEAAEHDFYELHEGARRQQAVRTGLMLRPNALYFQCLSQLVQAAMEVVAELHQVLDVPHIGKVDLHIAHGVS